MDIHNPYYTIWNEQQNLRDFDLPINFGLGKFKVSIIRTNSSISFVSRGLKRFSSATLLSNWPLYKMDSENKEIWSMNRKCCSDLVLFLFFSDSKLMRFPLTYNHALDKFENFPVTKKSSYERIGKGFLDHPLENQFDRSHGSTMYHRWILNPKIKRQS